MLLLVKPNWEQPRCSHGSWQALRGSVPISMDWEGTKAALEAGVEEGSCRAAGAGEGAMGEARAGGSWGSGLLQTLLLSGAAWPLAESLPKIPLAPDKEIALAAHPCGSPGTARSWYLSALRGGVFAWGPTGCAPVQPPGASPQASGDFGGQRESCLGQAGGCSEGRGRACSTVLRELCFLWHLPEKAVAGNGIFLLGAFTDFSFLHLWELFYW